MKTLVIGYFGYSNGQLDGQTVKTRSILDLYKEKSCEVDYFDTQILQKSKLYFVALIWKIIFAKDIIYLPGYNNLIKLGKPLLYICSLLRIKISYFVVGGWLLDFLNKNESFVETLKKFEFIYVETDFLKRGLNGLGLANIKWFPNFRKTDFTPEIKFSKSNDVLRLVFMARVMPEKGVDILFFLDDLLRAKDKCFVQIDIYGQVQIDYEEDFFNKLKCSNIITYKGVLQPEEIYKNLSNYDLLILPTYYAGEGFPGTIVDAYISGLPVITTNWKQIPEFIEVGVTGFLVEPYSVREIYDLLLMLETDRNLLNKMKENTLIKSREYSYAKALTLI